MSLLMSLWNEGGMDRVMDRMSGRTRFHIQTFLRDTHIEKYKGFIGIYGATLRRITCPDVHGFPLSIHSNLGGVVWAG